MYNLKIAKSFPRCAVALAVFAPAVFAQHEGHVPAAATSSASPIAPVVDGAVHPELIGDSAAAKILLISMAQTKGDPAHEADRLNSQMAKIGLAAADTALLKASVRAYGGVLSTSLSQRAAVVSQVNSGAVDKTAATGTLVSLSRQLDSDSDRVWQTLLGNMSPDGKAKMAAHLAYVKSKMKIVPPPPM